MILNFDPCRLLALLPSDGTSMDPQGVFTQVTDGGGSFFNFNAYNLLAGLVFGTLGWGAWSYGKKLELWQPRAIGVTMMVYPYLIYNAWLLWIVGVGLLVLLWFYHSE